MYLLFVKTDFQDMSTMDSKRKKKLRQKNNNNF